MLTASGLYRDLGSDDHARPNPERQTKRLISLREALGHHVTLQTVQMAG